MACGGAFGSGGFGGMPFGSGSGTLAIDVARAVALNAVDVDFDGLPQMRSSAAGDDALNPANWSLTVFTPHGAIVRLAQHVERRDVDTARVFFDGPLTPEATYKIIASTAIEDELELPIDPACACAYFEAFGAFRRDPAAIAAQKPADLQNPQAPQDAPSGASLGTFQIDSTGDVAVESGLPYLRKRVFRRATTSAGEFFHLPQYGFAEALKGTITPDTLRRMQARALAQILKEPDVADASVSAVVLPDRPNIVVLTIRVRARNGASEDLTVPVTLFNA